MGDRYEVQTTRIATQPLRRYAATWMSVGGLDSIRRLDRLAADAGVLFNIGPLLTEDEHVPGFAAWGGEGNFRFCATAGAEDRRAGLPRPVAGPERAPGLPGLQLAVGEILGGLP